ncbi:MAG TPA: bifunctional helix-turn-helix transcriptional regulator/GNAT family N-acetyltransferase [Phenylobacterium sp.]|jgi:DNA-binding MarR family transcriptional regulator/GNAT superfamily N-acetyltransferase
MDAETVDPVAAVRRFNRFYTRAIGVLEKGYLGTAYTVAEGRVLYEIATGDAVTPKAIGEITGLDAGYLSRITARLERDGLVARSRSATDGRSVVLRLTPAGAEMFAGFNLRSSAIVEQLIAGLTRAERARLVASLGTARALLDPGRPAPPVTLRAPQPGDMGWITERHGVLYAREYGWNAHIEAVTARICADFLDAADPDRERCWIAEREGERLGCVFLVKEDEATARLRLLLLEPGARGTGLGRRLVEACVTFAREAGYREVVLWTHAVLTAARAIYAAVGFELEKTWTHDDFGAPEVSETWRLRL